MGETLLAAFGSAEAAVDVLSGAYEQVVMELQVSALHYSRRSSAVDVRLATPSLVDCGATSCAGQALGLL